LSSSSRKYRAKDTISDHQGLNKMIFRNTIIAAVALSAIAGAAHAQSTANATAQATIVQPTSVSATRALQFGTIAKPSSGTTEVTVASAATATATPSTSGGNGYITAAGQAHAASFQLNGNPTQTYSLPAPTLTFTGVAQGTGVLGAYVAEAPVSAAGPITGTGPYAGTLNGSGTDTLYVGGKIFLTSSTPATTYNGTLSITVTFN
jgi:hypothetical protein